MDEAVDALEWLRDMRTIEGDMYQAALDKGIEAIRELGTFRDRAQDALTNYYANVDPAHLEDFVKELVR